jgi:hypothetical protein
LLNEKIHGGFVYSVATPDASSLELHMQELICSWKMPPQKPSPRSKTTNAGKPRGRKRNVVDKKSAFLAALGECATIKGAAKAARIARSTHFQWMTDDPHYPARFAEARSKAALALEESAIERAMIGEWVPNIYQGRFVYPEHEVIIPATETEPERREMRPIPGAKPLGTYRRSEMLHALLLRGFLPERYGWRGQFEVSGPGGAPIDIVERINAGRLRVAARNEAARLHVAAINEPNKAS